MLFSSLDPRCVELSAITVPVGEGVGEGGVKWGGRKESNGGAWGGGGGSQMRGRGIESQY